MDYFTKCCRSVVAGLSSKTDNNLNGDTRTHSKTISITTLKYTKPSLSTNQEKSNYKTLLAWQVWKTYYCLVLMLPEFFFFIIFLGKI